MLLLLSINLSADSFDEGLKEYNKGNLLQASKLYEKACRNDKLKGCTNLGVMYFVGEGIPKNHKKAKRLFATACKKKFGKACYYLGTMYKRGADDIDRNIRRARMFYAYACKLGNTKGCEQYELIREKPEVVGSGKNVVNSGYTYTPEIYGG